MQLNQPAALVLDDEPQCYEYVETWDALHLGPQELVSIELVPPGDGFELVSWTALAAGEESEICTVRLWRRLVERKRDG